MAIQNYTKPIELVLSKLDHKRSGAGYVAKCPAHQDSTASLSISEGSDRRVLLHCHAGCKAEAICQQLGIKAADLFPTERRHNPSQQRKTEGFRRQDKPKKPQITFATAEAAVADYRWHSASDPC